MRHTASRLRFPASQRALSYRHLKVNVVFGGTLNIMRHCLVARSCGVDAVMSTLSGRDTYGDNGILGLSYIRWQDRKPTDVCIVPDFVTPLVDEVKGNSIAYLQVPIHTKANFNYRNPRVSLWTDSPYMKSVCEEIYPGKPIEIVPNIIDDKTFDFIPQDQREPGLVFAFPRKGPEFIAAAQEHYRKLGGTYWRFELVDGISIHELARQFRRPQVFLASAPIEGCALPPQESMAAGIVVVGRTAEGANFCMEHRKTAMVAETPELAANCLLELEDLALRTTIARNARDYISQYFPSEEPFQFWQALIQRYSASARTLSA